MELQWLHNVQATVTILSTVAISESSSHIIMLHLIVKNGVFLSNHTNDSLNMYLYTG